MKTKSKLLPLFAIFALALFVGVASATSFSVDVDSIDCPDEMIDHDAGYFDVSFVLKNMGEADSSVDISLEMTHGEATTSQASFAVSDGTSSAVTIPLTVRIDFESGQNGVLQGFIKLEGEPTGPSGDAIIPFEVQIEDAPSVEVTLVRAMTPTQNAIVEVKNTGNVPLTDVFLEKAGGDFDVEFDPSGEFDLDVDGVNSKKEIEISAVNLGAVGFEGKSVLLEVETDEDVSDQITLNVAGSFCEVSEGISHGYLDISDIEVDNRGEGEDDEWMLMDEVEVTVEVSFDANDEDDEAKDVTVVLGLYDSDGKNQIDEMKFEDDDEEEKEIGDLEDGDDEEVTFSFRVPADFEDGKYKLVVKAYSDDVSVEGIEEDFEECIDTADDLDSDGGRYMSIDVQREDDEGKFIAFDDFSVSPSEASCGERVVLTFNVYNVGDEEQDQVKVTVRNSELGIDEYYEIREDMDEGDKESVSFEFDIPAGAEDGLHTLRISAEYDYDDGDYDESLDDEETFQLRLIGCGSGYQPSTGFVSIVASDVSADAGEQVTVRAVIRNTGSSTGSFILDATGFQSWATLDSISERIIELGAGESEEVTFTLIVDEDASGEESFVIEVLSGDSTESEQVFVDISESATGSSGFSGLGDNAYLWIIGAVNVILVVLIIVVAVRIARR